MGGGSQSPCRASRERERAGTGSTASPDAAHTHIHTTEAAAAAVVVAPLLGHKTKINWGLGETASVYTPRPPCTSSPARKAATFSTHWLRLIEEILTYLYPPDPTHL